MNLGIFSNVYNTIIHMNISLSNRKLTDKVIKTHVLKTCCKGNHFEIFKN